MALGLLLCVALVGGIEAALNCHSTGNSSEPCNNATTTTSHSYQALNQKFQDFKHAHDSNSLVYLLVELFKYSYPCASNAVAALYTFVDPLQQQSPDHGWEQFWNGLISQRPGFSKGNDTELQILFRSVESETNYNCLLNLYHYYVENGGKAAFEEAYDFFTPGPVATTTHQPAHTTAHQPAHTTTHQPTTTQPIPDLTCTVCKELECLIHRNVQTCPHNLDHCYIRVEDNGEGRSITRGCADQAQCEAESHNTAQCANLDQVVSHNHTVCVFCCQTANCNRPPALSVHH